MIGENATFLASHNAGHRLSFFPSQTKILEGRANLLYTFPNAFPGKHFSTFRRPNPVLTPLKSASPETHSERSTKGSLGLPKSSFGDSDNGEHAFIQKEQKRNT
jgi:hypothetical protein